MPNTQTATTAQAADHDQINKPVNPADYVYIFSLAHVCGGETVYLDRAELDQYNADPDLFAAKHFGLATVEEYREWLNAGGTALCRERTRSGRLCRNPIGAGGQRPPDEWRQHHRSASCFMHGGRS